MERKMYVELKVSPESDYISVSQMFLEENLEDEYNNNIENAKYFGFRTKVESLKGFTLKFILVNVEFDGRKRSISEQDILHSLDKQGLIIKKGEGLFGGYYVLTDQLREQLDNQLKQRKELISKGEYIEIAS